jgi:hypothetical protein
VPSPLQSALDARRLSGLLQIIDAQAVAAVSGGARIQGKKLFIQFNNLSDRFRTPIPTAWINGIT